MQPGDERSARSLQSAVSSPRQSVSGPLSRVDGTVGESKRGMARTHKGARKAFQVQVGKDGDAVSVSQVLDKCAGEGAGDSVGKDVDKTWVCGRAERGSVGSHWLTARTGATVNTSRPKPHLLLSAHCVPFSVSTGLVFSYHTAPRGWEMLGRPIGRPRMIRGPRVLKRWTTVEGLHHQGAMSRNTDDSCMVPRLSP